MSKDTIYREDAIKALRKLGHEVVVIDKVCSLGVAQEFIDAIRAIPSADRPHSDDWEKYSDKLWKIAYECGKADRPQGEWKPLDRTENIVRAKEYSKGYIEGFKDGLEAQMKGADDE